MYSLDVNFLKERKKEQQEKKDTPEKKGLQIPSLTGNLPLIIGAAVGLSLPAAVGGFWYLTNVQNERLRQEISALEQELSQLQGQQQQVTQKREELEQAQENLTAFANIFNQVKPLSVILEEVRDRAPDNIQIDSFEQSNSDDGIAFSLQGIGESYEAVNYFFLTLQRSPFVEPETVSLETAGQTEFQFQFFDDPPDAIADLSPRQVISYTLSFELNNKSASELLPTLRKQGAVGLVNRIQTLEQKGIIQ